MAHFNIPGQSRLLGNVRLASALRQKTDIHGKGRHVSKVPIPDNDPVEPMIISLLLPAARPSPGGSGTGSFSSASDRPRAATKQSHRETMYRMRSSAQNRGPLLPARRRPRLDVTP